MHQQTELLPSNLQYQIHTLKYKEENELDQKEDESKYFESQQQIETTHDQELNRFNQRNYNDNQLRIRKNIQRRSQIQEDDDNNCQISYFQNRNQLKESCAKQNSFFEIPIDQTKIKISFNKNLQDSTKQLDKSIILEQQKMQQISKYQMQPSTQQLITKCKIEDKNQYIQNLMGYIPLNNNCFYQSIKKDQQSYLIEVNITTYLQQQPIQNNDSIQDSFIYQTTDINNSDQKEEDQRGHENSQVYYNFKQHENNSQYIPTQCENIQIPFNSILNCDNQFQDYQKNLHFNEENPQQNKYDAIQNSQFQSNIEYGNYQEGQINQENYIFIDQKQKNYVDLQQQNSPDPDLVNSIKQQNLSNSDCKEIVIDGDQAFSNNQSQIEQFQCYQQSQNLFTCYSSQSKNQQQIDQQSQMNQEQHEQVYENSQTQRGQAQKQLLNFQEQYQFFNQSIIDQKSISNDLPNQNSCQHEEIQFTVLENGQMNELSFNQIEGSFNHSEHQLEFDQDKQNIFQITKTQRIANTGQQNDLHEINYLPMTFNRNDSTETQFNSQANDQDISFQSDYNLYQGIDLVSKVNYEEQMKPIINNQNLITRYLSSEQQNTSQLSTHYTCSEFQDQTQVNIQKGQDSYNQMKNLQNIKNDDNILPQPFIPLNQNQSENNEIQFENDQSYIFYQDNLSINHLNDNQQRSEFQLQTLNDSQQQLLEPAESYQQANQQYYSIDQNSNNQQQMIEGQQEIQNTQQIQDQIFFQRKKQRNSCNIQYNNYNYNYNNNNSNNQNEIISKNEMKNLIVRQNACKFCDKQFNNRGSLYAHNHRKHLDKLAQLQPPKKGRPKGTTKNRFSQNPLQITYPNQSNLCLDNFFE